jgi:hypothetical protein
MNRFEAVIAVTRSSVFPPPSSGGVHLIEILNVLEKFDLRKLGARSVDEISRGGRGDETRVRRIVRTGWEILILCRFRAD